jgi:predicted GNAT family acetyltransferase
MHSPDFAHNSDRSRFEIVVDGVVVGKTYYRENSGRRTFTHTEVDPAQQGKGLATQLIEFALAATRDADLRIAAECPTVTAYLSRHNEYDDIVDAPEPAE